MRMNKVEILEKQGKAVVQHRRPALLLAATAIIILSVTVLVVCCAAFLLIEQQKYNVKVIDDAHYSHDTAHIPPREYHVRVPKTQFDTVDMVHYYISVDEQAGTEFIALKDPVMLHIQNIIMIDHRKGIQVLYSSETAQCLLVWDDAHTLADSLTYLVQHNDRNVSKPIESNDYKVGDPITSMEDIPELMAGFCSISDSYWLIENNTPEWNVEEKYHVCLCSYQQCWCTYCAHPRCWGRCSHVSCCSNCCVYYSAEYSKRRKRDRSSRSWSSSRRSCEDFHTESSYDEDDVCEVCDCRWTPPPHRPRPRPRDPCADCDRSRSYSDESDSCYGCSSETSEE